MSTKQWELQLSVLTPEEVDFDEILAELEGYSTPKIYGVEVINGQVVGELEDEDERD